MEVVVPTTTPPLVWPSNGKNKGAPTKIFESYIYGGIEIMQMRFNAPNFSFDDWRYEVEWVLLMLCRQRLATGLPCPFMTLIFIWLLNSLDICFFYGLYMIEFIGLLSYPSKDFQLGFLLLTLVFPKLGLCHPNKGCSFLLF